MAISVKRAVGRDSSGRVRYEGTQRVGRRERTSGGGYELVEGGEVSNERGALIKERLRQEAETEQQAARQAQADALAAAQTSETSTAIASTVGPGGQPSVIKQTVATGGFSTVVGGGPGFGTSTLTSTKAVPIAGTTRMDTFTGTVQPATRFEFGTTGRQVRGNSSTIPLGPGFVSISPQARTRIADFGKSLVNRPTDTGAGFAGRVQNYGEEFFGGTLARFGTDPEKSARSFALGSFGGAATGVGVRLGAQEVGRQVAVRTARPALGFAVGRSVEIGSGVLGVGLTAAELRRTPASQVNAESISGFGLGASAGIRSTPSSLDQFRISTPQPSRAPTDFQGFGSSSNRQIGFTQAKATTSGNDLVGLPASFTVPKGIRPSSVGIPSARTKAARRFASGAPVDANLAFVGGRNIVETGVTARRPGSSTFSSPIAQNYGLGVDPSTGLVEYGSVTSGGQVLLLRQQQVPVVESPQLADTGLSRSFTGVRSLSSRRSQSVSAKTSSGTTDLTSTSSGTTDLTSPRISASAPLVSSSSRLSFAFPSRQRTGSLFGQIPGLFQPSSQISGSRFIQSQKPSQRQNLDVASLFDTKNITSPVFAAGSGSPRRRFSFADSFVFPGFGGDGGVGGFGIGRSGKGVSRYASSLTASAFGIKAGRGQKRSGGFGGFELRGL